MKKLALGLLLFFMLPLHLAAQGIGQGRITNTCNYSGTNAQTGTSYTVAASDNGKLITFSNAGAIAVTLPVATGFLRNFCFYVENQGVGTVTITPTTSTIDAGATLALTTNQGTIVFSDATNYQIVRGIGGLPTGLSYAAPTLTISSSGNGNGCVALSGNTSGTATMCAPAVAGTSTNAIISSNVMQFPAGSAGAVSVQLNAVNVGLYASPGVGATMAISGGDSTGFASNETRMLSTGRFTFCPSTTMNCTIDTGLSRDAAGVVDVGSGAQGDTSGTVKAAVLQQGGVNAPKVICSNVTPVTVNANVATDQLLMACTLPAGTLNLLGKILHIYSAAVYSTPAASTSAMNIKVKLCTVSGCGSGTVITLATITSGALGTLQVTNNALQMTLDATTQTAGASAAFEPHGAMTIDLGALNTAADSIYADINAATVGTIDSTAQLFLQITGAFSNASASNSMSQRQLIVRTDN